MYDNYYYSIIFSIIPVSAIRPFILVIPVAANGVGLIFAIVARKYKSRSETMGYTDDSVRKVGSVFSIFGIILNAVGLALGGVSLLTSFSSLYSQFLMNQYLY